MYPRWKNLAAKNDTVAAEGEEEAGLSRLRSLLSSLSSESSLGGLCRPPCRRAFFEVRQWETVEEEDRALAGGGDKEEEEAIVVFQVRRSKNGSIRKACIVASSQFRPYVKVFRYHYLYEVTDLLADIGGYLGLFLGLSVFSVAQFTDQYLQRKKAKERRRKEKEREEEKEEEEKEKLNGQQPKNKDSSDA